MSNEHTGSAEPQLRNSESAAMVAELGLRAPGDTRNKEWYSRGYLPHRDRIGLQQSITFRLADSLPQEKLRELKEQRELWRMAELGLCAPGLRAPGGDSSESAEGRQKIEAWLDAGIGCCALQQPDMANVMEQTLLRFDGEKYKLIAWCIMPNHVHVLIEPLIALKRIVQSWKSFTGRWALAHNAELGLRVPGTALWMSDYWDRYMRNEQHFQRTIDYIHHNPFKAGLCSTPDDWRWRSARLQRDIVP